MNRTIILITALCCSPLSFANDELDWELDFEIRQKSTLSNFPLEEIGGEELSNAVVEGALQSARSFDANTQGKPAFDQEQESNDKRKVEELDSPDAKEQRQTALELFGQFDTNPTPEIPQQVFQIPNGRTYGRLETTTVERE